MSFLNSPTEVNNSVLTSINKQMTMYFGVKDIDEKYGAKLLLLIGEANRYKGDFNSYLREGVIKGISFETFNIDDWLCCDIDTFAQIIEDCVDQLIKDGAHI